MSVHGPQSHPAEPDRPAVSSAVAGAVADLGEDHFPFRAGVPQPGPDETWYRFDELTTTDTLRDRVAELAVGYDDDRQVATAFLAARLLSPLARLAVRPVLAQRRAVIAGTGGLWLRRHPRGWHNGLSLTAPRLLVTGDDPLVHDLGTEVVEDLATIRHQAIAYAVDLAAPVVARLHKVGALGTRALWGQFGDAVIGAVARHHDGSGDADAVRAEAGPLLAVDERLWVDPEIARVEIDGHTGLAWRRDSCCLAYRLEGYGYCTGCPLLSRDEWWERSVASVRERAEETTA